MFEQNRRVFLQRLATLTGGVVLVPFVTACGRGASPESPVSPPTEPVAPGIPVVPVTKPEGWDPIAFNKIRGNAGAIPESYLPSINGPDGEMKHLGKHLPFVPAVDAALVPPGYLALMWGDAGKGYARHPNAARSEEKPAGHWYNWIRIRKAVAGDAEELESAYSEWPGIADGDNGAYAVFGGGEITDDGGRNTIYLAALPTDLNPGDTIRIYAHCLTHGEYVDFLTV